MYTDWYWFFYFGLYLHYYFSFLCWIKNILSRIFSCVWFRIQTMTSFRNNLFILLNIWIKYKCISFRTFMDCNMSTKVFIFSSKLNSGCDLLLDSFCWFWIFSWVSSFSFWVGSNLRGEDSSFASVVLV